MGQEERSLAASAGLAPSPFLCGVTEPLAEGVLGQQGEETETGNGLLNRKLGEWRAFLFCPS